MRFEAMNTSLTKVIVNAILGFMPHHHQARSVEMDEEPASSW